MKHNATEPNIQDHFWSLVDKNGPSPGPANGVNS